VEEGAMTTIGLEKELRADLMGHLVFQNLAGDIPGVAGDQPGADTDDSGHGLPGTILLFLSR